MKVLLTNDDGPHSPGLAALRRVLERRHDVVVVVPERQRSASGFARTYHKPLRLYKMCGVYVVNAFPADAVFMGLKVVAPDADLVVSGINMGENVGFEAFYGGGTVGAAYQAAALGKGALAVSWEMPKGAGPDEGALESVARMVEALVERAIPWNRDVYLVSVNVPNKWSGRVSVTTRVSFNVYLERPFEGVDPRGHKYYWRWGDRNTVFEEGTDGYEFFVKRNVVMVPLIRRCGSSDAAQWLRDVAAAVGPIDSVYLT